MLEQYRADWQRAALELEIRRYFATGDADALHDGGGLT
jgi:hypothetical protein